MAWKFDTEAFKNYGTGVYLYFRLLEMLFYTFLLMSVLSLPALLCIYKGDGLSNLGEDSSIKSLMKLSLGNQRNEQFNKIGNDAHTLADIKVSLLIIMGTDFFCSLAFLSFLILWKIKSN